ERIRTVHILNITVIGFAVPILLLAARLCESRSVWWTFLSLNFSRVVLKCSLHRYLYFGLSVAIDARGLAGCYFPRGCCVSACTSRGMKHSIGQLTFLFVAWWYLCVN
ncbi:hypothetical protein FQV22_0007852, partial [Spheniscus magellanicus]